MDVARAQVVYEPLDVIPGRRSVVIGVGWMNTPAQLQVSCCKCLARKPMGVRRYFSAAGQTEYSPAPSR